MAKKQNNELISSILYIVIGVLLAILQDGAIGIAMTVVGVLFIISGVLDLIKKNWAGGAISAIIGIAIIILGNTLVEIVLIVLGILVAIKGVVALINVLKKDNKNALEIVFPILSVLLGIGLAFGNAASWIILIAGILLAIDGVIGLIGALKK
jgi:uncharacterized membrane protein HdeD (DUF308 family)